MKLPDGLKGYEPQCECILSWMPDWLHQTDFDKKVFDQYVKLPIAYHRYSLDNYMPPLQVLAGDWSEAVWLTQVMSRHGMVKTARRKVKKGVWYKRIDNPPVK